MNPDGSWSDAHGITFPLRQFSLFGGPQGHETRPLYLAVRGSAVADGARLRELR